MASQAVGHNTPSDMIAYQRNLVRTGDCIPLGRMQKVAIGPSAEYVPPAGDRYIQRYGRMIELRDRFLPIAQSRDRQLVLVTAPLVNSAGQVKLPDLPDPEWLAPKWSEEEVTGKLKRDPAKDTPALIPQKLTDRCEQYHGQPASLEGTNFLIFQPVLRVMFQPEIENRLVGDAWLLEFSPDREGRHTALLVDHKSGECFFFGGRFEVTTAGTGE